MLNLRTCARALLFMLTFTLLTACGNGGRDIRNYYFPVRDLAETGLVYLYENTGSIPGPEQEYAYYLGVVQDTGMYLSITRYDGTFSPKQQTRQEIENDGVYLRDLLFLQPDSAGVSVPTETTLHFSKAFPFYLKEAPADNLSGYRLSFQPELREATTYVSLTRMFRGDTTINVLGDSYDAIVFDLAGEVSERDQELGDISPQFSGFEIYAKGLGLVQYERRLSAKGTTGGRLLERMPMPKFLEQVQLQRQND